MICKVCGADRLVATEYATPSVRAPAVECLVCKAIALDESVARSEGERDSVRLAIGQRAAAGAPHGGSGTRRVAAGVSVAEVEGVCSEIDQVLGEARLSVECLIQLTDREPAQSALDVHRAVQRIAELVDDLRSRCARGPGWPGEDSLGESVSK